jgi:RNA polymerase sigma-70 factor (ECF subfamily)
MATYAPDRPVAISFAPPMTDEELVSRARRGDLGAFEQLVERHRAVVTRVAARIAGADHADDVAQDAFLRAYHRLDRFRGDGPFRAWLLRIAHNTALNAIERRRVEPAGLAPEPAPEGATSDAPKTPAQQLEERERRERLEQKLRNMRPEHRAVLVLRDIEGFSYDEIASVTDAPLGSVKGRLHRARSELIDMLRRNTYDWELPR